MTEVTVETKIERRLPDWAMDGEEPWYESITQSLILDGTLVFTTSYARDMYDCVRFRDEDGIPKRRFVRIESDKLEPLRMYDGMSVRDAIKLAYELGFEDGWISGDLGDDVHDTTFPSEGAT